MEQHRKVSTVEAQQVSNIESYLSYDTCGNLQFAELHKMAYIETSGEIAQNFKEVSFVHSQIIVCSYTVLNINPNNINRNSGS